MAIVTSVTRKSLQGCGRSDRDYKNGPELGLRDQILAIFEVGGCHTGEFFESGIERGLTAEAHLRGNAEQGELVIGRVLEPALEFLDSQGIYEIGEVPAVLLIDESGQVSRRDAHRGRGFPKGQIGIEIETPDLHQFGETSQVAIALLVDRIQGLVFSGKARQDQTFIAHDADTEIVDHDRVRQSEAEIDFRSVDSGSNRPNYESA